MKVLHTYCLNYNIGDHVLGIGVKNLLRKYLPIDLIAETNLQGTRFDNYFIDNVVNKRFDLLVIGGGGIIHGAHWPNGWFWLIEQDLIRRIEIPFIVYGVGYNYFKDEGGIPAIGRDHLRETYAKAAYFSVRNDGSAERVEADLNLRIPEVPDPGFHLAEAGEEVCSGGADPDEKKWVIIQLADDKPEFRYKSGADRSKFIEDMRSITKNLTLKYRVLFAPHVYEDISISRIVADGIPGASVWDFSTFAFDRCGECLGFYKTADFVLAMRGHGQIIPIGFNVPVVALVNHPKHAGLMNKLGLGEYGISIDVENFAEKTLSLINRLENSRDSYTQKLHSLNRQFQSETESAFEEIRNKCLKQ